MVPHPQRWTRTRLLQKLDSLTSRNRGPPTQYHSPRRLPAPTPQNAPHRRPPPTNPLATPLGPLHTQKTSNLERTIPERFLHGPERGSKATPMYQRPEKARYTLLVAFKDPGSVRIRTLLCRSHASCPYTEKNTGHAENLRRQKLHRPHTIAQPNHVRSSSQHGDTINAFCMPYQCTWETAAWR
jgi:hypothetical protein